MCVCVCVNRCSTQDGVNMARSPRMAGMMELTTAAESYNKRCVTNPT